MKTLIRTGAIAVLGIIVASDPATGQAFGGLADLSRAVKVVYIVNNPFKPQEDLGGITAPPRIEAEPANSF